MGVGVALVWAGPADAVVVSSVKGETLCSVKDFRINLFPPGAADMIVLTQGSAAATHLLDECPVERLQQQGELTLSHRCDCS